MQLLYSTVRGPKDDNFTENSTLSTTSDSAIIAGLSQLFLQMDKGLDDQNEVRFDESILVKLFRWEGEQDDASVFLCVYGEYFNEMLLKVQNTIRAPTNWQDQLFKYRDDDNDDEEFGGDDNDDEEFGGDDNDDNDYKPYNWNDIPADLQAQLHTRHDRGDFINDSIHDTDERMLWLQVSPAIDSQQPVDIQSLLNRYFLTDTDAMFTIYEDPINAIGPLVYQRRKLKYSMVTPPTWFCIGLKIFDNDGKKVRPAQGFHMSLEVEVSLHGTQTLSKFELWGFVSHSGKTVKEGHYIAQVRSIRDSNKWVVCNDAEIVVNQGDCPIDNPCFDPYVLFYRKKTSSSSNEFGNLSANTTALSSTPKATDEAINTNVMSALGNNMYIFSFQNLN